MAFYRETRREQFGSGRRYKSEEVADYADHNSGVYAAHGSRNEFFDKDFYGTDNDQRETTYNGGRGKRFRRMVSCASIPSQAVIPEEDSASSPVYLTRQQRRQLNRVASFPSRLGAHATPTNSGREQHPTRMERRGYQDSRRRAAGYQCEVSVPSASPGGTVPTLVVCLLMSVGLCYTCYTMAHVVPLTQEVLTVHSDRLSREEESHDYLAVAVVRSGLALLEACQERWWLLGPVAVGLAVTLVTLAILHYDSVGGVPSGAGHQQKVGLQLGNVVAVMNGILMCLYFLFYNLKVKPEEEKRSL